MWTNCFECAANKAARHGFYIHLEFQAQWIPDLAERMFIYYSKLYLRYRRPILSLVVLGDDCPNWRPDRFESEIWGSQATLKYRTIKLWDYRDRVEELKQSDNPFAYFVLAHLKTLATQQDPTQRLIDKESIALDMLEHGFDERHVGYLLKFIDAIMTLPEDMEQTFLSKVHEYPEEKNMPIVAPIEKFYLKKMLEKGYKEGFEKGLEEGIVSEARMAVLDNLNDHFGDLPESLAHAIQGIEDPTLLRNLRRQANKMNSLEEMSRIVQEGKQEPKR